MKRTKRYFMGMIMILVAWNWTGFAADTHERQPEGLPFSAIALSRSEEDLARLMGENQVAELLFTGDMMFHLPQIEGARLKGGDTYDFTASFEAIAPLVEAADLAVANLETTLSGSRLPYRGYPQFNTPDAAAHALKAAGFDVLMTANNHSVDGGRKGLVRTLDVLDELGFDHTGTKRPEEDAVLVVDVKGIRIAMINGTYGLNGLDSYLTAEERISMIRLIGDGSGITAEIQAVRPLVDFVIILPHWGYEYQRQPAAGQKLKADDWFQAGADAIVGSHPHVIQPMEVRQDGRFIAYSLGNAISNQRERAGKPAYWQYTEDGVLLKLRVTKDPWTGETVLEEARAIPTHVDRRWTGDKWTHKIVPALPDDPETGRSWQRTADQIPGRQDSQNLSEIVMNV